MARIRTIKPEFFTSEDIVSLSPLARLLYIACWCESDREGRLEWKPGTLKLRYFPGDACQMDTLATELLGRGLLVTYEVDGKPYAEIPSFARHQIINNRESASHIPARKTALQSGRQHGKEPSEATRDDASGTRESGVLGEGRKEGKGGRVVPFNGTLPQEPADPGLEVVASLPLVDGTMHAIERRRSDAWAAAFPAVDVVQNLHAMGAWLDANPRNRKTLSGIERFVVGWLGKAQNSAPRLKDSGPSDKPWAGAI